MNSYIESDDYLNYLKKKYPLDSIERHIKSIENMGYTVSMTNDSFQVWDNTSLLIDADFHDDYYLNAIEGIESFYL